MLNAERFRRPSAKPASFMEVSWISMPLLLFVTVTRDFVKDCTKSWIERFPALATTTSWLMSSNIAGHPQCLTRFYFWDEIIAFASSDAVFETDFETANVRLKALLEKMDKGEYWNFHCDVQMRSATLLCGSKLNDNDVVIISDRDNGLHKKMHEELDRTLSRACHHHLMADVFKYCGAPAMFNKILFLRWDNCIRE